MPKTVPSFGTIYAATRVGYKWAPDLRLFIRVNPIGAFFKVEIQPPTFDAKKDPQMIAAGDRDRDSQVGRPCLWHGQEGILGYMPVLNKYMGKSTPHTFYMDDDGQELPPQIEAAGEHKKVGAVPIAEIKPGEPAKER